MVHHRLEHATEAQHYLDKFDGWMVQNANAEPSPWGGFPLHRWLVSYASESGWYRVGEYIALDAAAAIERAVEVFGPGTAYQTEEIPWDAAPLSKAHVPVNR
jgi:hypothetical protein